MNISDINSCESRFYNHDFYWLQDIPIAWNMVRLKYLTAEPLAYGANEAALEDNPNFPRFIRITDIKEDGSLRSETFKSLLPQVAEPYLLQEGDILFARSGATVGKTFIYRKEWGKACFAGYLIRFRCNCDSLIPDFLFFFTQSNIYWTQVHKGTIQATIQKFSAEKYSEVLIPLPSLSEQRAIANYLDYETAKIDTLISAKEHLLDLLTEKRQSLITHVITHGLSPNIPMLDCGIDWIGKIPQHWNIVQLKRITQKIGSGKTPKGGSEIYLTKGIPLIRSQNVLFSGLVISELVYISEDINAEMSSSRVQPYDVLINITGASIGRCCVVPECISQGNVNQHVCIIRPNFGTIKSEYLNAVLASNVGQTQVFMNQEGIFREGLTFEDIGNFWIPLPPQDEQEKLIQFIQKYSSQLSKLYSVTKNTIKLLQERRTALITAAVTGQIKVIA